MFSPISSCYTNTVGHVSGPGLKCIHFLVIEDHPVSLPNCPGGSPSQLLWKERCWRPLYFSFLRTVQITNPRIYHCIQYSTVSDAFHLTRISREIRPFPSHLKLSFKDLLCTISTFQGKNCLKCLERTFKNREVFDSRCPFAVPQGPGGLALSSLDRKKAQAPAWAQRLLGWWAALFGYSRAMRNWPSTGWKTLTPAIATFKEIAAREASQKSSWECVVAHPVAGRCWHRDPHVVTGARRWYSASGCGSCILQSIEIKL